MVRVKHRYLLVHILRPNAASLSSELPSVVKYSPPTPKSIDEKVLLRAIRAEILSMFGDYGSAVAGTTLKVNYFSNATSTFILRVPRDHYRLVWAALTYMTTLPGLSKEKGAPDSFCVMRVVRVSGTIRKAEEEAVRRARQAISKAQAGSAEDVLLAGLLKPDRPVEEASAEMNDLMITDTESEGDAGSD